MSFAFQIFSSPVGPLYLVATNDKLHAVLFEHGRPQLRERFPGLVETETPVIAEAKKQLGEYFAGMRREFDLPYTLSGTEFQKRVWSALAEIPFGKTRSYREQAASIDSPGAVRAVGRTNGLNLLSIVLPCHRVIGSDGSLTGYGGGLDAKRFLLEFEGKQVNG